MPTYSYIRASGIRQLLKENGKRCSSNFLDAMDRWVFNKVRKCVGAVPEHQKTLDDTVVNFTK